MAKMEKKYFEKQVQQRMEDLKILPSDDLWKKIEVQIEKKKQRRWGYEILCLLFLISLSGYFLFRNYEKKSVISVSSGNVKLNISKKPSRNFDEHSLRNNNYKGKADYLINDPFEQNIKRTYTNNNTHKSHALKLYKAASLSSNNQKEVMADKTKKSTGIIYRLPFFETISALENIKENPEYVCYKFIDSLKISAPLLKGYIAGNNDSSKQKSVLASALYKKNNKWRFGLLFSGGVSGTGMNFPGLRNSGSNSPAFSTSLGGTFMDSIPSLRSGFGFIIGIIAERNIFKRTKMVTGINFKYFSTSNLVGNKNDITKEYSVHDPVNRYVNHYSFLEIPLGIKARLTSKNKVPVFVEGGIVFSEQLTSNALQFDQNEGTYRNNNILFNKTQFGFNTAVTAGLFSKHNVHLLIGPYFYYGTSKIANTGLYNKKHFIFSGLRTELNF